MLSRPVQHPRALRLRSLWLRRGLLTARAAGLWLLLTGAVVLPSRHGLPPVIAQPVPVRKPLQFPPLTVDEQAAIKRVLAMGHQDEICSMPMRLQVTRASLADIVAHLKPQVPQRTLIEVRCASPARFTLILKEAPLRQVLQAVADLADCNFYILSDRLLLAKDDQLTPAERVEADQNAASAHSSEPQQYFQSEARKALAHLIVAKLLAVQGQPGVQTTEPEKPILFSNGTPILFGKTSVTFGQLSPELQQTVQQWFGLFPGDSASAPQRLAPDTTISFAANARATILDLKPGLSSGQHRGVGYSEMR